ncbi:TetR/AcrR family transcriptional regulator [Streptomyces sp. NPDC003077]|uniref:TetR/AcrR family transcriptional regulator n=1 Tax=Streptomyces sp. NPDC003077 TaxID=3154443 RepID=UPI00339FF58E
MTGELGLRERKKDQTRRKLWSVATRLFIERGYDKVSVAEVAAAAEVSKMTVFNYCPSKEDLVVGPLEEHVGDTARAVRERAPGESAPAAVRRQFLDALAAYDASVGMSDDPYVLQVRRLIAETPALLARAHEVVYRAQQLLTAELTEQASPEEAPLAPFVAAQLMGVRSALMAHNHRRLLAGESAADVQPAAVALAERAFALLENGLAGYATRPR